MGLDHSRAALLRVSLYAALFLGLIVVAIAAPVIAVRAAAQPTVTAPTLSVGDVTVAEIDAGSAHATFTISLSSAAAQTVTVRYVTANGSAVAWSDYRPALGSVIFAPGVTSRTVVVQVLGDTTDEPAETFLLRLSSPVGAAVADGEAAALIQDNDPRPLMSIGDVTVTEADGELQHAVFTVSLTNASSQWIAAGFATRAAAQGAAAVAWIDYIPRAGTIAFAPGVTEKQVIIRVRGDLSPEPAEHFAVMLSAPLNVDLATPAGDATIVDDDPSATWSLSSSDTRTRIGVALYGDGRLSWNVSRDGIQLLADSPLGIDRADQPFSEGLRFVDASTAGDVTEVYRTVQGKRRDHAVSGREMTLTFETATGAPIQIVLRAHDDGVAFRYRFPELDATARTVTIERTGFRVAAGSMAWMLPHSDPFRFGPAYEEFFREVPAGTPSPSSAGWSFPALFKTPSGRWLLVTEAALDEHYCGSRLAADVADGTYRLRFPDAGDGRGVGSVLPTSSLPWTLPWRVVVIGDSAGRILESDLVSDLSPASRVVDTSWIEPGRSSWSWWSDIDSPGRVASLNLFTDLAAEMTWQYALVDAGWTQLPPGGVEEVVAHAREKGVRLFFWYNSGGDHNDIPLAPRDRMHDRSVRRAEFARLRQWGAAGVKVDFWHSDKQDRIRQYRELLADAADFGLLVNLHGSTIPRGWSREFPNLMTMEAVLGAEQYLGNPSFPDRAAWHNTVLPFTRNAIGSMDYTPVTFSDAASPRRTTHAHELALSVVFESGVQHFPDSADAYGGLPEAARSFLQQVPAAWDDTRALGGEPGRFVVVARRESGVWYVGGLNGQQTAMTATVDLGFLGTGAWSMSVIADGGDDRSFDTYTRQVFATDIVDVPMRANGGFALRLVPAP